MGACMCAVARGASQGSCLVLQLALHGRAPQLPPPKPTLLHVSVQIAVRTVRRSARRCVPIGISLGATTAPPASAPATEE